VHDPLGPGRAGQEPAPPARDTNAPSGRSDRIGRLLEAALERPAAERAAFLAAACGDDDVLQHEVESLLSAHEQAGMFLATRAQDRLPQSDAAADARLPSGMRLGPYEVVGRIGAGGMGEVYRARDTRLDRDVALKVLNRELAARPQTRERFEREARAVSRLTHPHICALYDVGRASSAEGEVPFLVMELVEGETLAARLARGPMPVPEAITVASQIGDALAAAHAAGIVHRDLKPANIMLARTGAARAAAHVRLLDFGLARLREATGGPADPSQPGTLTTGAALVGTLPYMAPEQVRGEPADARADLFAFGAVLYEMLTGRRPFAEGSQAELTVAILERMPPPPSTLQPDVPEGLDLFIHACLAKAPAERWQSAQDVVLQLKAIEALQALDAFEVNRLRLASRVRKVWRRARASGSAAAITLGLGAALLVIALRFTPVVPPAPAVRQLDLSVPRLAALESLAVSPDGERLAFISDAGGVPALWIRSLGEPAARAIPGTDGAHREGQPFWSPDGEWIAFVAGGQLRRVRPAGGEIQALADAAGIRGGIWGPDGTLLVGRASATHGVHRLDLAGGRLVPLVPLEPHAFLHALPKFLSDGRRFLYFTWTADERHRDICIAALDRPSGRCLGVHPEFFVGLAEQREVLFTRGGTLFAQPFDARTERLTDAPRVVLDGIAHDDFGRAAISVAAAGGTLVYQPAISDARELVWMDRRGTRVGSIGEATPQAGLAISADGAAVAVTRPSRTGTAVWTLDAARGAATTAASTQAASAPFVSPDGLTLTYLTRLPSGHAAIVERPMRGGPERVLFEHRGEGVLYFADRSADATQLVVGIADRRGRFASIVPASGGTPLRIVGGPGVGLGNARIAPDRGWLAYESRQTGRSEVYLSPIPSTGEEHQVSVSGGQHPYWSADGRELLFVDPDGWLMSAPVTSSAALAFGIPQRLFKTDLVAPDLGSRRFAVTADGERMLIGSSRGGRADAETSTLRVVLNWPQLGVEQVRAGQATPSSQR
jgi:eukaryotic-like serine/threonine-protein kinase